MSQCTAPFFPKESKINSTMSLVLTKNLIHLGSVIVKALSALTCSNQISNTLPVEPKKLTPETTVELLDYCKTKGELPPLTKWGSLPMNGQLSCEGTVIKFQ